MGDGRALKRVLQWLLILLAVITCLRIGGAVFVRVAPRVMNSDLYLGLGDLFLEIAGGLLVAVAAALVLSGPGWTRWVGSLELALAALVLLRFAVTDPHASYRLLWGAAFLAALIAPFVTVAVVVGGVWVAFFRTESARTTPGEVASSDGPRPA